MSTTSNDIDIGKPFREFAGPNGDYYADVFLNIQKATLPRYHINRAALIGSFVLVRDEPMPQAFFSWPPISSIMPQRITVLLSIG